jgi:hypothetical protein
MNECDFTTKTINIDHHQVINFNYEDDFAESFVHQSNCDEENIYIPVNSTTKELPSCIVYKYNLLSDEIVGERIKEFPNKVILGTDMHNGIFYGCVTNSNEILIYDTKHDTTKYVGINGCPNDLQIDTENNMLYIIANVDYRLYNGELIAYNIKTCELNIIAKDLFSASGINIVNDTIYVATLANVVAINSKTYETKIISSVLKNHSFMFDNIQRHGSCSMDVAIYNYEDKFQNYVINHPHLLIIAQYLFSCCFGVGYLNYTNPTFTRKMSKTKRIKFINITHDHKFTSYTINNTIDDFDFEITQLGFIEKLNKYVLVNWKANKFLIIDKYSVETSM